MSGFLDRLYIKFDTSGFFKQLPFCSLQGRFACLDPTAGVFPRCPKFMFAEYPLSFIYCHNIGRKIAVKSVKWIDFKFHMFIPPKNIIVILLGQSKERNMNYKV